VRYVVVALQMVGEEFEVGGWRLKLALFRGSESGLSFTEGGMEGYDVCLEGGPCVYRVRVMSR
jgi:hypothetical protein